MARLRTNPVRSSLRAALAALVLACVAAAPALAQGSGEVVWSQFQGGPAHLGTAASAPLPPYREAWRFESHAGAVSGPVVVGDTAIAVGEHAVLAVSLETGELAWQVARNGGPLSMPAVGTPLEMSL
jgi:outer membrane protein assembly factor BamB